MCEKCVEAVQRVYPQLSEDEQGELLMEATAFPFASPEKVEEQLVQHKANTDGTMQAAIDRAHAELDRAMEEIREQREQDQ